jgi:hypothetical protein
LGYNNRRKQKKKVIVAVNKIDNPEETSLTAPFYKLGLGHPIAISAIHGIRINDLLDAVENKTVQFYKPYEVFQFNIETINELKKNSLNLIDIQINILMNNLMILLNKNKDFSLKYTTLIKNFGVYDINDKLENKTPKEKVLLRNNLYRKKLDYFKKFYINIFKKYLSIIKNNYDILEKDIKLEFIDSSDLRREMQQSVGQSREKFNTSLYVTSERHKN